MSAKVLVVEDSDAQRALVARELERRGLQVIEASGGAAALSLIQSDPPDVVVLDIVLDDIDGHSICRWIRSREPTRDIVIIMLTVKGDVQERIEGLQIGADDYVPKPFDMGELHARIVAGLRSRKARLELRQRNSELEDLLSRTEQLAMTDALTGILNRRRFAEVVKQEWASAKRYRYQLSLLLCDLDHFKAVNDERGHSAGDEVLKAVAQIIAHSVREVDYCARYGGDEFILLLPHTPIDSAVVVATRIRERLLQERSGWEGVARDVGLSVGIATNADARIGEPEQLVDAADRALYRAKAEGRNRTVIAEHHSTEC